MEKLKGQNFRKEYAFAMIFAIYLYIYASIATMTNKNSVGYLDADMHLAMYYINQLIFVSGIFLNAFFWHRLTGDDHKSLYLKLCSVIMFLGSFIMILYPCTFSFLVLAPIVHLFLGILGGAVNYFLASALLETGVVGRVIALGASSAYLLQYFVQIMADNNLLLLVFIIASGITIIPIIKNSWQWILLEYLPSETADDNNRWSDKRYLLCTAMIISAAATVLLSYCDSWFINQMVSNDLQTINTYTWPRLFMILGYLFIGFVGDYKNGRFLNFTFFSIVLWLFICPVLLSDNVSITLIMVLFYMIVGVYMGYMYFMSLTLAPYTGKYSIVFASSCRIIEGIIGVAFSFLPWNRMETWHIIAIGIVSVSVMLTAIARYIIFNSSYSKTIGTDTSAASKDVISATDSDIVAADTELTSSNDAAENSDYKSTTTDIDMETADTGSISTDIGMETADTGSISTDTGMETADTGSILTDTGMETAGTGSGSTDIGMENPHHPITPADAKGDEYFAVARISEEYDLTDREREVFEKLIFTEDSGQEIADALYISRRVLQRHVAAIYEKTGTKSRVGLFRIYHKMSTLIQQD